MKVLGYPQSSLRNLLVVTAKYASVELQVEDVSYNQEIEELSTFPLSAVTSYQYKFPVLVSDQGVLFGVYAIARFLARQATPAFYEGLSNLDKASTDTWLDFAQTELSSPINALLWQSLGYIPKDTAVEAIANKDIQRVLTILNEHLLDKTFLVTQRLSLADVVVSLTLFDLFTKVASPSFRKPFSNVIRWFQTCLHQPHFVEVIPSYQLTTDQKDESWKYGGVLPSTSKQTVITFNTAADLKKWISADRFWLFGLTWSAKVSDNKIILNYFNEEKNFAKVYKPQLDGMFHGFSYTITDRIKESI